VADLVLSNALIDEYLKYIFQDDFNGKKIKKLFRYIEPFAIRDTHPMMSDPSMPMMLENDPMIEIIEDCSDDELVSKSRLKMMLVDRHMNAGFTILNILGINNKLDKRFGGTYPNSMDKNKAQKHIKSLLEDAKWIRIADRYLAESQAQWERYQEIFQSILPNSSLSLTFESSPSIQNRHKVDLQKIFTHWKTIKGKIYDIYNTHDRYIETDKLIILLSSGIFHLSSSSNTDFTYVVTLKGGH
jgi:hypothetical protein